MRGGTMWKPIAVSQHSSPNEQSFSSPYLAASKELDERGAIDHVYAMVGSQSAAQTIVTDYFRANQPFERGSRETVQVEVNAILPNSPHTYEVDWTETQRTLDGKPISSDKWKGIFTVAINPSTDEAVLRVNPFGIYVMDISWSKVL